MTLSVNTRYYTADNGDINLTLNPSTLQPTTYVAIRLSNGVRKDNFCIWLIGFIGLVGVTSITSLYYLSKTRIFISYLYNNCKGNVQNNIRTNVTKNNNNRNIHFAILHMQTEIHPVNIYIYIYIYIIIIHIPYSILNSPLDDIPFNILAHHIHLYKFDTKCVNRCS